MSDEEKEEAELVEKEQKWCTAKFFIGVAKVIINLSTIAWGIYTVFVVRILNKIFVATNGELKEYLNSPVMLVLVIGWVVVTFVTACNLQKAFSTMIENAKITAEIKAVAELSKKIDLKGNADAAQILEAAKKQGG